jgi:hypothetical protein
MAMKRSGLAILFCFLLCGCIFDPVFDTSSWSAYQRSSAAIKAKLSNDDLRRLEVALKYLESDGAPQITLQPQNVMVVRAGYSSAEAYLGRLGSSINGRSGAAVIQNLTMKLDAEISAIETRMQSADKALAAVEVTGASYRWRRSGNLEQPVIEFSVYNAGKVPISRVYLTGVLTTPNRTIPWVKQAWIRAFKGGLEPRERQRVTVEPRFGEWNDRQLKDLYNAELKVTVTNFEDVNGEKYLGINLDSLDAKRKVRASLR